MNDGSDYPGISTRSNFLPLPRAGTAAPPREPSNRAGSTVELATSGVLSRGADHR